MARKAKPKLAPAPPRCVYVVPGEGRCVSPPSAHGDITDHCSRHVQNSPVERARLTMLSSKLSSARRQLDDLGNQILESYVVHSSAPIPEDTQRTYRNLWYRWNHLRTHVRDRRPGDPIPVEITERIE